MNKSYRKRELQRITQENQAILRRIQACEPSLNRAVWEEDRRQNEKWLRNICENPFVLRGPGRRRSSSRRRRQEEYPDDLYETDMGSMGGMGRMQSQSLPRLDPAYQAESQQRMQNSMSQGYLDYEARAGSRGSAQRLEPLPEQRIQ